MGWYITIQQEMRDLLGLKGNELIVFAFINGYSQEGQGCYYGSLAHLQEVCGIASRQTAIAILKSLCEKGYIIKTEQLYPVKMVSYSVCPKFGQGVQKLDKGCPEIGHNNKEDININTLSNKGGHRFQKPSLEDVREYCDTRANDVDPEQFFDHYESNGWMVGKAPMKDWRAAVRNWERRDLRDRPARKENRPARKESSFERSLREFDRMYGTNFMEDEGHGKD